MALRQASAEQRGPWGATAGTGLAGCDARFEVLPIHAQGRVFLVGSSPPWNRSSRGPSAPWHGMPSEAVDVDVGQLDGW